MDTRLVLKLDKTVIARAKEYASNRKISLSKLVESYLNFIIHEQGDEFEISHFVKSIPNGTNIPLDINSKTIRPNAYSI